MLKKEHQAIQNPENVCFHCLKELHGTDLIKIHIPEMGWDSKFDSWGSRINLCNSCYNLTDPEWWELEEIIGEYGSYYKYEDEIFNFVKQFPLAGQELFWNKYSTDWFYMESQDWIDYELGILSHTTPLSLHEWLLIIGSTSVVLWVGELWRAFKRMIAKRR